MWVYTPVRPVGGGGGEEEEGWRFVCVVCVCVFMHGMMGDVFFFRS